MKNKVFIIAGPSGVGKNLVIEQVLKKFNSFVIIPTYTTRMQRKDDLKNKNRICVTEKKFTEMIVNGKLIEWKKIHTFSYGKKKTDFESALNNDRNIILDVDVQGLSDYKKIFGDNLISIFITYESLDLLKQRILKGRPETTLEEIGIRLETAKQEMKEKEKYDFVITNIENHPEIMIEEIFNIIKNSLNEK